MFVIFNNTKNEIFSIGIGILKWDLWNSPRHAIWSPIISPGNLQGFALFDKGQVLRLSSKTMIY